MTATRRTFLQSTAALTAASQSRILGANDRIRLAGLGTGGRCRYILENALKIGGCDTGVTNALPTGLLLSAKIDQCAASAKNRGQFVACTNVVTNAAKDAGFLTGRQHAAITSCAAQR